MPGIQEGLLGLGACSRALRDIRESMGGHMQATCWGRGNGLPLQDGDDESPPDDHQQGTEGQEADAQGQAFETVNREYSLEMDVESLLEKVRSKSVKAAAIDLGKKRPALKDRWKVVLARAVAEASESYEGKLDREIRDVLKNL